MECEVVGSNPPLTLALALTLTLTLALTLALTPTRPAIALLRSSELSDAQVRAGVRARN